MGATLSQPPPEHVSLESATEDELKLFWARSKRVGKGATGYLYEFELPSSEGSGRRVIQAEGSLSFAHYLAIVQRYRQMLQGGDPLEIERTIDYSTLNSQLISAMKSQGTIVDFKTGASLAKYAKK